MYTRTVLFGGLILGLLACAPELRHESEKKNPPLEWDLSYGSLITTKSVGSNDFLVKWLNRSKAPAKETMLHLLKDSESAILLEYPAFHAGERLTFLLARSETGVFCWTFAEGDPFEIAKTVNPDAFDFLVQQVSTWKQEPPQVEEFIPGFHGYFGIISVRNLNISKQLLLNLRDFKIPTGPKGTKAEPGKVYKVFLPVIKIPD